MANNDHFTARSFGFLAGTSGDGLNGFVQDPSAEGVEEYLLKEGISVHLRTRPLNEGSFPSDWPFHLNTVPECHVSIEGTGRVERRDIYFAVANGVSVCLNPDQLRFPYTYGDTRSTVGDRLAQQGFGIDDLEGLIIFSIRQFLGGPRYSIAFWQKSREEADGSWVSQFRSQR